MSGVHLYISRYVHAKLEVVYETASWTHPINVVHKLFVTMITGLNHSYWSIKQDLEECQAMNADIIFWNHDMERFNYLNFRKDANIVHNMKSQLNQWKNDGYIIDIRQGSMIRIQENKWYPLEVKINSSLCYANFLLSQDESWEDAEWTPFMFSDRSEMLLCLDWLKDTDTNIYHC